jgi:hypothetical protein
MSIFLSPVLHASSGQGSERGLVLKHWCPGCKGYHLIEVEKPNHLGYSWTWDGNAEQPTVHPSINIVGRCHYFVQQGNIVYCSDSIHSYAGKTIPMPVMRNDVYNKDDDNEYLNDLDFGS